MSAEALALRLRPLRFERVGCVPALPSGPGIELRYPHHVALRREPLPWSLRSAGLETGLLTRGLTGLRVDRVYSCGWGLPSEDPRALVLLEAVVADARTGIALVRELKSATDRVLTDVFWRVGAARPGLVLSFCARLVEEPRARC